MDLSVSQLLEHAERKAQCWKGMDLVRSGWTHTRWEGDVPCEITRVPRWLCLWPCTSLWPSPSQHGCTPAYRATRRLKPLDTSLEREPQSQTTAVSAIHFLPFSFSSSKWVLELSVCNTVNYVESHCFCNSAICVLVLGVFPGILWRWSSIPKGGSCTALAFPLSSGLSRFLLCPIGFALYMTSCYCDTQSSGRRCLAWLCWESGRTARSSFFGRIKAITCSQFLQRNDITGTFNGLYVSTVAKVVLH